ncbi:MAG: RNA-binding S4 domain-containing protein [Desulfobulbus sp.]|nr:MAG: RNA-binding S4 domain-containing protein [Desulfobulbus sp.]
MTQKDPGRIVRIAREPIELYQLLKLAELAASGGEAKFAIARGQVRVNGLVETRKRNKIRSGDLVEFAGERLQVAGPEAGVEVKP